MLGAQSVNDFVISFFPTLGDDFNNLISINPNNYINAINPQTIFATVQNLYSGCYAIKSFTIEVQPTLKNSAFELKYFSFEPNPVVSYFNLKSQEVIDNVIVYNLLGQLISNAKYDKKEVQMDLSILKSGTYFVKVISLDKEKTFKIEKK